MNIYFSLVVVPLLMVETQGSNPSSIQPSLSNNAVNNDMIESKRSGQMHENKVTCWHTCFRQFRKRRPPPVRQWLVQSGDSEQTTSDEIETSELLIENGIHLQDTQSAEDFQMDGDESGENNKTEVPLSTDKNQLEKRDFDYDDLDNLKANGNNLSEEKVSSTYGQAGSESYETGENDDDYYTDPAAQDN